LAASGPYQGIILGGSDPIRRRYFVDYENFAGGQGALCNGDGMDAMQVHMANTSNLPIEVMETEFPVRVERYEIVTDSCGAGRFRGGCGIHRDLRMLAESMALTTRSARQKFPAYGVAGGLAGTLGSYTLDPLGPRRRAVRSTVSEFMLGQGDVLRITTPGGGGFGDPCERNPDAVLKDVREGKVSRAAAERIYRVVLSNDRHTIDRQATQRLRRARLADISSSTERPRRDGQAAEVHQQVQSHRQPACTSTATRSD
jgi:N-methylhydantoinase B